MYGLCQKCENNKKKLPFGDSYIIPSGFFSTTFHSIIIMLALIFVWEHLYEINLFVLLSDILYL
jgi:hypothetical protein